MRPNGVTPGSCLDVGRYLLVEYSTVATGNSGKGEGKHGAAETTGSG